MTTVAEQQATPKVGAGSGHARRQLGNRFACLGVSSRARGLAVDVNLNPDRRCNFNCLYCDVDRTPSPRPFELDIPALVQELADLLELTSSDRVATVPGFESLPPELLRLRHVALSGEGEPTLCQRFAEVVRAVVHLRALGRFPFFKLVLYSNASLVEQSGVGTGLQLLTARDEVWLKLDAGSEHYFERIARPTVPFARVLENIRSLARQRPVVIQSLFPMLSGVEPPGAEIEQYVARLRELLASGAQISLVQICSATRPAAHPECAHLALRSLCRIAQAVRSGTNLAVEVF